MLALFFCTTPEGEKDENTYMSKIDLRCLSARWLKALPATDFEASLYRPSLKMSDALLAT